MEKRIKEINEKKSLTKRLKKIKVQVNYIHYMDGKKVKTTKGNMFINQDTADALNGLKEAKENEALFLKFAKEFSKKASRVSAGDKIPSMYINSSSGKFRIYYYVKIYDRKTGKFISEPARINLITGIIEVSKTAFVKNTVQQRIKILLSLYTKWVNKNELKNGKPKPQLVMPPIRIGGKLFKGLTKKEIKDVKSKKSIKSDKVLIERKAKAGINNKARKGKKNPVRQKNNNKRKGIK